MKTIKEYYTKSFGVLTQCKIIDINPEYIRIEYPTYYNGIYNGYCCETTHGKVYVDTETNEILSKADLKAEYIRLKQAGETETETFEDYLKNCLSKNIFCVCVKNEMQKLSEKSHEIILYSG